MSFLPNQILSYTNLDGTNMANYAPFSAILWWNVMAACKQSVFFKMLYKKEQLQKQNNPGPVLQIIS